MQAKILRADRPFFGVMRKVGDILTHEEMGNLTDVSIASLVSHGIIEVEGMAAGASQADKEQITALFASMDAFRESTAAGFLELSGKLDALAAQIALIGVGESGTRKTKK